MGLLDGLDQLRKRPGPGMDIGLDKLLGMKPPEPLISQTPPAGFNFSKMDTNAPAPLSTLSYPDIAGGNAQPKAAPAPQFNTLSYEDIAMGKPRPPMMSASGKIANNAPRGLPGEPPSATQIASPLPVTPSPSAASAAPGLLAAKSSPSPLPGGPPNLGALANPPPRPPELAAASSPMPPARPPMPTPPPLPPERPPELTSPGGGMLASAEMPSMAASMASAAPSGGAGAAASTGSMAGLGDIFGGILGIAKGIQGKPPPPMAPPRAPQVAPPQGARIEAARAPQMQQMGKQIMSGLLADDVQSLLRRRATA
jgi:hypothetical protein